MRRILIWISRAIVVFVAVAIVGAVAINVYDPPLNPAVRAILDAQPTVDETARRAFYFVVGTAAGATGNVEAAGEALWQKRNEADFGKKLDAFAWNTRDFERCRPDAACTIASLARDPNLVDALTKNDAVVRAYTKLMEYGEGTTLTNDQGEAPISGLPANGHQLFLLQLARWFKAGGRERVYDLLTSSNAYMQSFLRTGSFFDRLVAAVNLRANRRFVTALTASGARVPDEILRSFAATPTTASVIEGAAQTELRFAYHHLRSGDRAEGESLDHFLVRRLFLRPNETLNLYDEALRQLMASDCPDQMDVRTCLPMLDFPPALFFVNPVGKRVVLSTAAQLHGYRTKMQNILREVRE